jgi:hypothetical protein
VKQCSECRFDKDIMSYQNGCTHKWHNDSDDDMCCLCGLDYEYLYK